VANSMLAVDLGTHSSAAALVAADRASVQTYPSPPSLDPAFLAHLRGEAQRAAGEPVEWLTVTGSAAVGTPAALIQAGEAAGFRDVEYVSPAVGAVLADQPALGLTGEALVLVCDLGQTWTTTLLRVAGHDIVEVAQEATSGGRDLDALLLEDLRSKTTQPLAAGEAMAFLQYVKHRSAAGDVRPVRLRADLPEYQLTSEWLGRLAEPGLRWVVGSCRSLIARACAGLGVAPGSTLADVAAVLLVGGCARLPNAEAIVHDGLRRPVHRPVEPEVSVVRGAARFAATAPDRRIAADHPKWRVEPLSWAVPGGRARLVRWTLEPGQAYRRGAVLAQIRTDDERIFDLTAPAEGVLIEQPARVGDLVGPTLAAVGKRAASCLAGDPPERRQALTATGEWLLTPDRRLLVECAATQGQVKLWSVPDFTLVDEFVFGPGQGGRVFVDPSGRLCFVTWNPEGAFTVWDVLTGRRMVRFRDAQSPQTVLVNEAQWRLTASGEDSAGRYRRSVATVWDLRTGERLVKLTDNWRERVPGYRHRSGADGFGERAVSPDGRLHAVPVQTRAGATAIALQEASSEHEVFRTAHPMDARARMAFTPDGRFLLANWESDRASQVDLWEL
jgi:molecular chaperone DnaK